MACQYSVENTRKYETEQDFLQNRSDDFLHGGLVLILKQSTFKICIVLPRY